MKITNVSVSTYNSDGTGPYALRCQIGPDAYHVWLDRETKQPQQPHSNAPAKIYKNPAANLKPYDAGYYKTRELRANTQGGQRLIAAMMSEAISRDLFTKAVKAREEAAAEDRRQAAEMARLRRIREAGPELLEALRRIQSIAAYVPSDRSHASSNHKIGQICAEAIAKAEASDAS